jgi:hypothetical protein
LYFGQLRNSQAARKAPPQTDFELDFQGLFDSEFELFLVEGGP